MITIDDQLLVTDEMNVIVIEYTKKIVLKKLLMAFSFESKGHSQVVTDLIQSVNYYGMDTIPPEIELELSAYVWSFFTALKKEERTALYFWILNKNYLCYLDEFEYNDNTFNESEFDRKFGRELAFKIYEPNDSGLIQDSIHSLKNYVINFAMELDLSLVDEYTSEQILEEIDNYCL
ncbi:hypothetical protein [Maribacter sp. ACAM166]|uniref:hypothetical protein n=1 Tax=Maribacter sp. ACAM166 TaxID=2508996 RepID=UPI0010FE2778|nr:hypothetical protein [Maribacter sp. ACAM166]TLP79241.1 hypothetical protein ES765_10770 [Maribacter sp. ACAM166]